MKKSQSTAGQRSHPLEVTLSLAADSWWFKAHSHFVCYNETSFNTSLNPTNLESIGLVYNIFQYLYQCDGAFASWSAN